MCLPGADQCLVERFSGSDDAPPVHRNDGDDDDVAIAASWRRLMSIAHSVNKEEAGDWPKPKPCADDAIDDNGSISSVAMQRNTSAKQEQKSIDYYYRRILRVVGASMRQRVFEQAMQKANDELQLQKKMIKCDDDDDENGNNEEDEEQKPLEAYKSEVLQGIWQRQAGR